jgi:hypothetical protein
MGAMSQFSPISKNSLKKKIRQIAPPFKFSKSAPAYCLVGDMGI